MPVMVDYDETAELADLRKLLRSGPRTNRARPTELVDAPAAAPPADDVMRKASRLSELLKTHEGLDEAEPLMRQELTQRESTYGFGSEHTLVSATCLAMCLQAKGVVDEALRLYNRVVEGYEALPQFGPDHTDTLNAVNNLAVFLKSLGSYEKALPLYERVLAGDEAVHGADHPHTLDSVFNLARLYDATGECEKAVPLYQRELAGCTQHYGKEHSETKTSAHNFALFLEHKVGDAASAKGLREDYGLEAEPSPGA